MLTSARAGICEKRYIGMLRINAPRVFVGAYDFAAIVLAWQGLILFRYLLADNVKAPGAFLGETAVVVLVQFSIFWYRGLYRGLWRFASMPDLRNIIVSCAIGAAAITLILLFWDRAEGIPRFVLLAYPFVLAALVGIPRFLYRSWKDHTIARKTDVKRIRLLIVGASTAGESLVRNLRHSDNYEPIGFVDDNPRLHGAKVQGLLVLGSVRDIPRIAKETAAEQVAIAAKDPDSEQLRQIVKACEKARVPFLRVPNADELLRGWHAKSELREVAIEDLLGRDAVVPDWVAIRKAMVGKTVLVTGAGGSIGSELCRQSLSIGVSKLVLIEFSELALQNIHMELMASYPHANIVSVLGDCGDMNLVRKAVRENTPHEIFHAAAYKHVPLLESHPREAMKNNVLATETLVKVAREENVESFVLISTDKAVDPANILGASKRLAELTCLSRLEGADTRLVIVRFGNVLDSAGSVVPIFREQIKCGGPITVTHPEVTRYFMTIPEACQLILQTTTLPDSASIYTLDMGKPVQIRLLAEQMIFLAGLTPEKDIKIQYTGLRPGEKLHESLFHADESYRQTLHAKIFLAEATNGNVPDMDRFLRKLRDAVNIVDQAEIRALIAQQFPDILCFEKQEATFRPQLIQGGKSEQP